MNKQFPIIPLNGMLYAVDTGVCPQIGDISIHGNIKQHNHVIAKVEHEMQSLRDVMLKAEEKLPKLKGVVIPPTKVIAANDEALIKDGIPSLPSVEEDNSIEALLFSAWRNGSVGSGHSEEDDKKAFNEWWENGAWYKAAKGEGKLYTEKDLKKALLEAQAYEIRWSDEDNFVIMQPNIVNIIKSLNKSQPIAVELEIQFQHVPDKEIGENLDNVLQGKKSTLKPIEIPKTDKNNQVIIKRWVYE